MAAEFGAPSVAPIEAEEIQPEEFDGLMASIGPFEPSPHLAVAVSGGADSMALALLADRWARARRGRITALVVDHGLRPESADEARLVADWLAHRGIAHAVLAWTGAKPRSGIQARARAARYDLLADWCTTAGVLHLLLGHHREDQAETVLMRRARGSGIDGLAAMAPIVELAELRLLRPLLDRPKARLAATLTKAGQIWIDDPSNRDPAHWRARLRAFQPVLDDAGFDAAAIGAMAARAAGERVALERASATLLARAARIFPAGHIRLDAAALAAAAPALGRRALVRCLLAVGGTIYAPRRERLERLFQTIVADAPARRLRAQTLAGCRIQLWPGGRRVGAHLLICREVAAMAAPVPIRPGGRAQWDGRFALQLPAAAPGRGYLVGALGVAGWTRLVARQPGLRDHPIPPPVRPTLPALLDEGLWHAGLDAVLVVPHLFMSEHRSARPPTHLATTFAPAQVLGQAEFFVAGSVVRGV